MFDARGGRELGNGRRRSGTRRRERTGARLGQERVRGGVVSPHRIVVVLFVTDAVGVPATETWGPHLASLSAELGVAVEPWFAEIGDTAVLARASTDPTLGLVALAAPPPNHGLTHTSSPLEDALPVATSSFLLLRHPPPIT